MDDFYKWVMGLMGAAIVGLVTMLLNTKTKTDNHEVRIKNLEDGLKDMKTIPDRLTKLETTFDERMGNVSDTLARLESHIVKRQQKRQD